MASNNGIVLSLDVMGTVRQIDTQYTDLMAHINTKGRISSRKMIFSLDPAQSAKKISDDISTLVNILNKREPPKIKIKIDQQYLEEQIAGMKLNVSSTAATGGAKKSGNKNPGTSAEIAEMQQLKSLIKEVEVNKKRLGQVNVDSKEYNQIQSDLERVQKKVIDTISKFEQFQNVVNGTEFANKNTAEQWDVIFGTGALDSVSEELKSFPELYSGYTAAVNAAEKAERSFNEAAAKSADRVAEKKKTDEVISKMREVAEWERKLLVTPDIPETQDALSLYTSKLEKAKAELEELAGYAYKDITGSERWSKDSRVVAAYAAEVEKTNRVERTADERKAKTIQNIEIAWDKATIKARDYLEKYRDILARNPEELAKVEELAQRISRHDFKTPKDATEAWYKLTSRLANESATVETKWQAVKRIFAEKWGYAFLASLANYSRQVFREMYENVKLVDSAMTELKKVTDESEQSYKQLLKDSTTAAPQIGAKMSDYINSVADFSRVGYDLQDAQTMAQAANIYKNVADGLDDINAASTSIISTTKAFGIEANNTMHVVDAFNEVGNNFAISSAGIGDAMQRSASAMAAANNTFEETIGLIVGMNDTVQDADKVGNTAKTMSMYLRAAKSELEEAGEDTDGIAESVSKLRDVILDLTAHTSAPVDIMLDNNTYKSTYQISKEISAIWDEISDKNQAFLLEKLGGKRNANAIASLMTNFADAEAAMQTAVNSTGSAARENERQLDSINGKIVKMQSQFEAFSVSFLDSESVKIVLDLLTGILKVATGIVDTFGSLPIVFMALPPLLKKLSGGVLDINKFFSELNGEKIKGIFAKSKSGADEASKSMAKLGDNTEKVGSIYDTIPVKANATTNAVKKQADVIEDVGDAAVESADGVETLGKSNKDAAQSTKTATTATKGFAAALKALAIEFAIALAIEGAVWLFNQFAQCVENAQSAIRELGDTVRETKQKIADMHQVVSDVSNRYAELSKGVNDAGENIELTNDEFEEYNSIVDRIEETFPNLVTGYDSTGQAILACKDDVSALNDELELQIELLNQDLLKSANQTYKDYKTAVGGHSFANIGKSGYASENKVLQALVDSYENGSVNIKKVNKLLAGTGGNYDFANALVDAGIYENKWQASWKIKAYSNSSNSKPPAFYYDGEWYELPSYAQNQSFLESINTLEDDINNGMSHLTSTINANNKYIDEATDNLKQTLMVGLQYDDVYATLGDTSQQLVEFLVGMFDYEDFENGIFKDNKTADDFVQTFYEEFGDAVKNQDVLNLYDELLGLDRAEMSIDEWRKTVEDKVAEFADSLGLKNYDKDKLYNMFGFDTLFTKIDAFSKDLHDKLGEDEEVINDFLNTLSADEYTKAYDIFNNELLSDGIVSLSDLKDKLSAMDNLASHLSTVAGGFNDAADAASNYKQKVSELGGDYDESFNTAGEALGVIKSGLESGDYRSKSVQLAVEFLYGKDTVSQLLSGELSMGDLQERYNLSKALFMTKDKDGNETVITTTDQMIDKWREIQSLVGKDNLGSVMDENSRTFKLAADDIGKIAEAYNLSEDQVWSWIDALRMGMDVQLFNSGNIQEIKDGLSSLGVNLESGAVSAKDFNSVMSLLQKDYGFSFDDSTIADLKRALDEAGISVIDFDADAETLAGSFADIFKIGENGSLNIEDVIEKMAELGATREEIDAVVKKLETLDETDVGVDIAGLEEINSYDDALRNLYDEYADASAALEGLEVGSPEWTDQVKVLDEIQRKIDLLESTEHEVVVETVVKEGIEAQFEKALQAYTNMLTANSLSDVPIFSDEQMADAGNKVAALKTQLDELDKTEVTPTANLQDNATDSIDGLLQKKNEFKQGAETKLSADGKQFLNAYSNAQSKLDKYSGTHTATLSLNASGATGKLNTFVSTWDEIKSKSISLTVNAKANITKTVSSIGASVQNIMNSVISGVGGVNGTAFASGYWGATRSERALVGELGAEMRVNRRTGRWELLGENGAEFANIAQGDIIFNAEQTRELLKNGHISGRGRAFVDGTAYAGGTAYASGTSQTAAEKAAAAWESALKAKDHALALGKISEDAYWTWYAANYKKYLGSYKENVEKVWEAEEAIYNERKEATEELKEARIKAFEDVLDYHQYLVDMERITDREYWDWYKANMHVISDVYGANSKEYHDAEVEYYQADKKLKEEAYDAVADLIDARIDMIKDETDKEIDQIEQVRDRDVKAIEDRLKRTKDAINEEIDAYKKLAQAQLDALKDAADEEDYLASQSEKRQKITELQYRIGQLRAAGDAASIRKAIELEKELADATKDLTKFERDRAIELREDEINKALEEQEDTLNKQIEDEEALADKQIAQLEGEAQAAIDRLNAHLENAKDLRERAMQDIVDGGYELYVQMLRWNEEYGDGITWTIIDKWDAAANAVSDYKNRVSELRGDMMNLLTLDIEDMRRVVTPSRLLTYVAPKASSRTKLPTFAGGTSNAPSGLAITDENGAEIKLSQTSGNGRYSLLNSGDFVFTHEMSQRLYDFAKGDVVSSVLGSIVSSRIGVPRGTTNNSINVKLGDINISGSANEQTVSAIRREQRRQTGDLLRELKRLQK